MNPMEIVIPKTKDDTPHETVPYFFGAKDGWWKNVPTLFGVAQTQMEDGPPGLMEATPTFLLNDLKVPAWVLSQAHDFFRTIWEKEKAESSVYILYSRTGAEFKLYAPEQYVTGASVNHKLDRDELPAGFTPVGTIHSHCNFSAFHSGTDTNDMAKMPGLHITIGHVERAVPEMVFALSMGEQAFDIKRNAIIDEEDTKNRHGYNTMPPFWPKFVHKGTAPWGNTGVTASHTSHKKYTPTKYSGGQQKIGHGKGFSPSGLSQSSELMHRWDQQAWNWDGDYIEKDVYTSDDRYPYKEKPDEKDPFKRYEDVVEQACDEMDELVSWLNAWGFAVSYNLTYDKKKASDQDTAFREKRMQNYAPTP